MQNSTFLWWYQLLVFVECERERNLLSLKPIKSVVQVFGSLLWSSDFNQDHSFLQTLILKDYDFNSNFGYDTLIIQISKDEGKKF